VHDREIQLMTTINVKGLADLQRFLDQLPAKMEANVMRGALRAAAKPIKEEAQSMAKPIKSGALRDSIRVSGRIDAHNGKVTASVKAGGKKNGADVFYAHFIEFGTKPHSLKKGANRDSGKYQDVKHHPGISSRPFMRPALDAQAGAAVEAAGEYIKKRLATKNGFDTSEINIELEE